MKPIPKIFIDMDGVLADFFGAAFRMFGRDPSTMPCAFNGELHAVLGCTEEELWSRIDEQHWMDLEPLPDARAIVDVCNRFSDAVGILTSPGNDPRACSGKKAWVQKHFPDLARRTFIGSDKGMLAHPGAVLLDDWEKQVLAWRNGGGVAYLVPRRWNSWHEHPTLDTLYSQLAHQAGQPPRWKH